MSTLGSAHNSLSVGELLEKMIDVARIGKMKQANVEVDEYEECINDLKTLRESYTRN